MKRSFKYVLVGGLLASAFLPLSGGAQENINPSSITVKNDETIASALGANGKFFIVTADEAPMHTAPNDKSKIRMTFLKNSCLMSLGNGRDQNGYAPVLAMGGDKKHATGFVDSKNLIPEVETMNKYSCIAIPRISF